MTHIADLGSTNMDLVAYVEKAPQRGETVTGRQFRTVPGAGDTFVGALAVALAEERPVREALIRAAAAASISVQRAGASASMPYRPEIEAQYTA